MGVKLSLGKLFQNKIQPERSGAEEAEKEVVSGRGPVEQGEIRGLLGSVPIQGAFPEAKHPGKGGKHDEESRRQRRQAEDRDPGNENIEDDKDHGPE